MLSLIYIILFLKICDAFGAGYVPASSNFYGTRYRHGDIENSLTNVQIPIIRKSKNTFFTALIPDKRNLTSDEIKHIYFGNWLSDYSRLIDGDYILHVTGLNYLTISAWLLSTIQFHKSTKEFEITLEKLGVHCPEAHVENQLSYHENPSIASKNIVKTSENIKRPQLDVDMKTGMKNYIANEKVVERTSFSYVQEAFKNAIKAGRIYNFQTKNEQDLHDAYRFLGQGLHTIEDFYCNSNYVELALINVGYKKVFPKVGENTTISIDNKTVYPLTTGLYGSKEFLRSLITTNSNIKTSQVEFVDLLDYLNSKTVMSKILTIPFIPLNALREIMTYNTSNYIGLYGDLENDPTPTIYSILKWKDTLAQRAKFFTSKFFYSFIEKAMNIISFSMLKSTLKPIFNIVVEIIKERTSNDEIYIEKLRNSFTPSDTNPMHMLLSKDDIVHPLNEPAGKAAIVAVQFATKKILEAMMDDSIDIINTIDEIKKLFYHPAFIKKQIQMQIYQEVENWVNNLGEKKDEVIGSLDILNVFDSRNIVDLFINFNTESIIHFET